MQSANTVVEPKVGRCSCRTCARLTGALLGPGIERCSNECITSCCCLATAVVACRKEQCGELLSLRETDIPETTGNERKAQTDPDDRYPKGTIQVSLALYVGWLVVGTAWCSAVLEPAVEGEWFVFESRPGASCLCWRRCQLHDVAVPP
jgi:hypothetical protein